MTWIQFLWTVNGMVESFPCFDQVSQCGTSKPVKSTMHDYGKFLFDAIVVAVIFAFSLWRTAFLLHITDYP